MKRMTQETKELVFKLMVALCVAVIAVVSALIVFALTYVAKLEMLSVAVVGVGMATIVALVSVTIWRGLVAYRS